MPRDFAEWDHLTDEVGYALVDAAPQGWCRIDLMSRAVDTVTADLPARAGTDTV